MKKYKHLKITIIIFLFFIVVSFIVNIDKLNDANKPTQPEHTFSTTNGVNNHEIK